MNAPAEHAPRTRLADVSLLLIALLVASRAIELASAELPVAAAVRAMIAGARGESFDVAESAQDATGQIQLVLAWIGCAVDIAIAACSVVFTRAVAAAGGRSRMGLALITLSWAQAALSFSLMLVPEASMLAFIETTASIALLALGTAYLGVLAIALERPRWVPWARALAVALAVVHAAGLVAAYLQPEVVSMVQMVAVSLLAIPTIALEIAALVLFLKLRAIVVPPSIAPA